MPKNDLARRDDVAAPIAFLKSHQHIGFRQIDVPGGEPDTQVRFVLPVDIEYWVSVQPKTLSLVSAFEVLINGLEICINRSTAKPTLRADAALAVLQLHNWQRAIAWCMQMELKIRPLAHPFTSADYKAFKPLGECVHAKLQLIWALVSAFDAVGQPCPLPHDFPRTFIFAMMEDINRDIRDRAQSMDKSTKRMRAAVGKLKDHQDVYGPEFPANSDILQAAFTIMPPNQQDNNEVKRQRLKVRNAYASWVKEIERWNTHKTNNAAGLGASAAYVKNGQVVVPKKDKKGKPGIRRATDIPPPDISI
jgi:hypothetical protein